MQHFGSTKMTKIHMVINGIFILTCIAYCVANDNDLIVSLPYGKIKGHVLQSENGNPYYAFQEIPYASPPVGNLRFKPPELPTSWEGILDTTSNTKICYQLNPAADRTLKETEDCLYLNVFTPQKPSDSLETLLPVFVWIHGGGFNAGYGTIQLTGPKFFIDYNIIIVAINYRLGPLGFLTTGDGVIPGNLGLKDQNFALKWVKDNIKVFGGDLEKITIGGESAGAISVGYQLISKQSKGLFRGAILQSGTVLSPAAYQASSRYLAFQFGYALNSSFNSDDSEELLDLLQNTPADVISYTQLDLPDDVNIEGILWAPVIENEKHAGAFITGPMHDDIKNGKVNQVPVIIGFNSEEEVCFIAEDTSELKQQGVDYDKDISSIVHIILNMTDENKKIAGSELRKIYTDGDFQDNFAALVSYTSDYIFTTPSCRHADLQSQYTDVYVYQLSYKGDLGGLKIYIEGLDRNGVGHVEDLLYLWDVGHNSDSSKYPEDDILTRNRMLKMWSNFIKYLNPTPEEDSLLQNITWPKVSPDSLQYLDINASLEAKTDPKQYKKWKQIIDTYAIPPLILY